MIFMITLIMGIIIMMSSKTWFSAWLGLEINLMSFIPLLMLSPSKYSSEASLKYFLIQAVASLIILQTSLMWTLFPPLIFITIALALKLGMAPMHFWLPYVAEKISWFMNIILLTVQKVGPFFLMNMINPKLEFMLLLSMFSACAGALGGLNEMLLRKLMAYSSINHMGWICLAMNISYKAWTIYLFTYMFMSATLITVLKKYNMQHLNQMYYKQSNYFILPIMFLSLGGFPPLLGFAPKWMVIYMSYGNIMFFTFILILTSMLTLFFYIRTGLSILTLSNDMVLANIFSKSSFFTNLYFLLNLGGGLIYMLLWSFMP
uniref:NADH-ubiquinone oxidoreductase chain 2 n=1 Tax=Bragasellus peltatus TaxID=1282048 RepID=A0A485MAE8_9CRUS|nr:NADH dehydrogenase subunit 2 [Bragasellus peltatus]